MMQASVHTYIHTYTYIHTHPLVTSLQSTHGEPTHTYLHAHIHTYLPTGAAAAAAAEMETLLCVETVDSRSLNVR